MTPRHAVYFAPPPTHALWQAGCEWLGRDPRASGPPAPPARPHVQSPWRYGFHATLKAPMRLSVSEAEWLADVQALALRHARFTMPPLQVDRLGDFLALRPVQAPAADHALRRLADDCVRELDPCRAPPTPAEHERQRRGARSARQQEHVDRWGYAHVFDDWRFHLTLTDPLTGLDAAEADRIASAAQAHFAKALRVPLHCDALCVFTEPAPGAPFRLVHRFALGAA